MLSVNRRYDSNGPLIQVSVFKEPPVGGVDAITRAGAVSALIDTGASFSCISYAYATRLELDLVGKARMFSVNRVSEVNLYAAELIIHFDAGRNKYLPERALAQVNFHPDNPYHLLIGMDIISMGDLGVQSAGTFHFSMAEDL